MLRNADFVRLCAMAAIILGVATDADAAVHNFTVSLDANQEVPDNASPGTASGTVTYDDVTHVMVWDFSFMNLTGPATGIHFHGPAGPGVNAGVRVNVGAVSGLSSPNMGMFTISPAFGIELQQGLWYLNIHTAANVPGEIRGQVVNNSLAPGDIAITGYNSDTPVSFSFVALTDLPIHTNIAFTDRGWLTTDRFRNGIGDDTLTWWATSTVSAGTVVIIDLDSSTASTGNTDHNMILSDMGDQIIAFQGETPGGLIAAIQMNGPWDAEASDADTSSLPSTLTNGTNALFIDPEMDNARYDCSVTGPTAAAIRAAINDLANWTTSDTHLTLNNCGGMFTVPVALQQFEIE